MFSAKKYLKIRELETTLYGGPQAIELNYEKDTVYISDTQSRSRDRYGQKERFGEQYVESESEGVKEEVKACDWYEYQYDSSCGRVSFKSLSI